jgi:hypothetical protein
MPHHHPRLDYDSDCGGGSEKCFALSPTSVMTRLTSRKKYHSSRIHHDDNESSMMVMEEEEQGGATDKINRVSQSNEGGEYEEDEGVTNNCNNYVDDDDDEEDDEDVNWSIRSNTTFVMGGLLQLAISSWDYIINKQGLSLNQQQYFLYNLLCIAGPLVYFLNSVIDVRRVLTVRERRRKLVDQSNQQNELQYCRSSEDGCEWSGRLEKITATIPTTTTTSSDKSRRGHIGLRLRLLFIARKLRHWQHQVVTTIVTVSTTIFQRSTIHAFGRRRELGAATKFGIAALLSIIGVLCRLYSESSSSSSMLLMKTSFDDDDDKIDKGWELSTSLEGASVHIYLVSAILALWRWPPPPLLFMPPSSSFLQWCCFGNCSRDTIICVSNSKNKPATTTNISCSSNSYDDDDDSNKKGNTTPWYSDVGSLETLGDALFGLSSMVDVCLQDANINEIYWWQVASSLLWTVDALLYLRGDFVSLYGVELQHRRPS